MIRGSKTCAIVGGGHAPSVGLFCGSTRCTSCCCIEASRTVRPSPSPHPPPPPPPPRILVVFPCQAASSSALSEPGTAEARSEGAVRSSGIPRECERSAKTLGEKVVVVVGGGGVSWERPDARASSGALTTAEQERRRLAAVTRCWTNLQGHLAVAGSLACWTYCSPYNLTPSSSLCSPASVGSEGSLQEQASLSTPD